MSKVDSKSKVINLNEQIMKKSFLEAEEIRDLTGNLQAKFFFTDDKDKEKEEEKEDQGDRKGGRIEV